MKISIKKVIIGTMIIFGSSVIYAQEVKIGDKLPEVFLKEIIKYNKSKAFLLKEFGGKPLIIDFWSRACHSCIENMPHVNKLQQEFKGSINILLSTYDQGKDALQFLQTNIKVKDVTLPSVTNDVELRRLFPHLGDPHQVWINKFGIVVAISDGGQLSAGNIRKLINNEPLNLPLKKENLEPGVFVGLIPVMVVNDKYEKGENVLKYSYLGGYTSQIKGSWPRFSVYDDGQYKDYFGIRVVNAGYKILYSRAYEKDFNLSQIIRSHKFDEKNSFSHDFESTKNKFCYDYLSLDTSKSKAKEAMIKDLDAYFNVTSKVERQTMPCYVLTASSGLDKIRSNGKNYSDLQKDKYVLENIAWRNIMEQLKSQGSWDLEMDVLDETGLSPTDKVTLNIPLDWSDLNKLNKSLEIYGLKVQVEQRIQDIVILKDNL